MLRHRFSIALVGVLLPCLSACTGGGDADSTTGAPSGTTAVETTTSASAITSASPTPPAIPEQPPATRGPVASDCVEGWKTPIADSARYRTPLRVIRRVTGQDRLEVVDMRFFDGPESPPSDKGYLLNVERWYVKAFAKDDPAFQGRFLVEQREYGIGLVAVAPYDTNGFHSPDWTGFQFDSGDTEPRAYPGIPGTWSGVPYDFVKGGAGLQMSGLPDEVVGCLSGT
jgi:hypothetical protein